LGSVGSLVSEKKIFEISANQSILLALAAMLNIRLEQLISIRHADILKRAYLCQVSDTGSPEPLVLLLVELLPSLGVRRLLSVVCKFFTFQDSSPKPVEYPTGTKNSNFVEDHPRNIPAKFGSNWPRGFGEES
jgi:hypothetical protein